MERERERRRRKEGRRERGGREERIQKRHHSNSLVGIAGTSRKD